MRELTKKEKELIAGGAITQTYETMFVSASYHTMGLSYDAWNDNWGWDRHDDYSQTGSGGGGGTAQCKSSDPAEAEKYVDALASKVARDIIAKSDDQRREYVSIVWRDGHGKLQASELVPGKVEDGVSKVKIDLEAMNIPVKQVVGIVHNHDKQHYGGSTQEIDVNRNPSENDWNLASYWVSKGASSTDLALYVIDTQGGLRQYDYADKSRYVQSNGKLKVGAPVGQTTSKTLTPSICN